LRPEKKENVRSLTFYLDMLCLAPSASPHLSLGSHDASHEGVGTRCPVLSLPSYPQAKANFRIGSSSAGV